MTSARPVPSLLGAVVRATVEPSRISSSLTFSRTSASSVLWMIRALGVSAQTGPASPVVK